MRRRLNGVRLRRVALAAAAAAALSACDESPTSPPADSVKSGTITDRERSLAEDIVRQELDQDRLEDATIDSASVTATHGIVAQQNTGHACDSERLLRIRLIGDFPHIVTSGPVLDGDAAVEEASIGAVLLTADSQTGQVCLFGVRTGAVAPASGATILALK